MSTILAIHDPRHGSVLATDSQSTEGNNYHLEAVKGIEAVGCAWGGAGSMAQVQRGFRWLRAIDCTPTSREGVEAILIDLHSHLVGTGNPAADGNPARSLVCILVATPWGVASMDGCGAIDWVEVAAYGTGEAHALGAVRGIERVGLGLGLSELARAAVGAAIAGDIYCGGDIQLFRISKLEG